VGKELPTDRADDLQIKGGVSAPGGLPTQRFRSAPHFTAGAITLSAGRQHADEMELSMDLVNVALLLIFIAIIAIIPIGCRMTRGHGKPGAAGGAHH
jgi:hypothetical protein